MMKYLTVCAALVLSISSQPAVAASEVKSKACWWYDKYPTGPMTFIRKLGTVHVPRDAQVGRQLGGFNVYDFTNNEANSLLECFNRGTRWHFKFEPVRPLLPIHTIDGSPILQTNIPGIGARIELVGHSVTKVRQHSYLTGATHRWCRLLPITMPRTRQRFS